MTAEIIIVEHADRLEWGRGVVIEEQPDRLRCIFEHAGEKTLLRRPSLRYLDLAPEERAALSNAVLRRRPTKLRSSSTGPGSRRSRPEEPLTFAAQEALFRARFPLGFEDEKYLLEERGTPKGRDRYKDAAIVMAHGLLAHDELEELIADDRCSEVFARAVRVLRATRNLVYPKTEKPMFEAMPPESHPRFARALRTLLFTTGDYATAFDELVSSIAMKTVPWTVATLFPAFVHPATHVFVKPTFSVRQAAILRLDEPPLGLPTGAGYAQHLDVARELKKELLAVGHQPRDMLDVYSFAWITQNERPRT